MLESYHAVDLASGAVSQGNHAKAASNHSVVANNVYGPVTISHREQSGAGKETAEFDEKLARYFRHLAIECRRLPLEVIDSKFLDGQEVRLPDIYVPLHALRRTLKQVQPKTSQEEEKRLPVLDALTTKERRAVLSVVVK